MPDDLQTRGQVSMGPSGLPDQSFARTSALISPPPATPASERDDRSRATAAARRRRSWVPARWGPGISAHDVEQRIDLERFVDDLVRRDAPHIRSAVMTTTGMRDSAGSLSCSSRNCQPFMPGIIRSSRMTSGRTVASRSRPRAETPFAHGIAVTGILAQFADGLAQRFVVFDDHDRADGHAPSGGRLECGPSTWPAVDTNATAHRLGKLARHPQPHAQAPEMFGRRRAFETAEDALLVAYGNTDSTVLGPR